MMELHATSLTEFERRLVAVAVAVLLIFIVVIAMVSSYITDDDDSKITQPKVIVEYVDREVIKVVYRPDTRAQNEVRLLLKEVADLRKTIDQLNRPDEVPEPVVDPTALLPVTMAQRETISAEIAKITRTATTQDPTDLIAIEGHQRAFREMLLAELGEDGLSRVIVSLRSKIPPATGDYAVDYIERDVPIRIKDPLAYRLAKLLGEL